METITVLNKALEISNLAGLSVEELEEIQKRQIWLTDQETTVRYARETGIQQGIDQGEKKLVNRLIRHRFADISPEIENKINQLAIDQLELLGEQLFDFSNENDLINWLDSHYQKSDF
jgi:tRNA/tmRNA/rRNA uracil-C5-methylase (TrmA/RlmC/RlmD family)